MARAGFYTSGKQDTIIIIVVVVPVILINANEGKTSCTNSVYDFLRLVCRRNNPNKKTLIYIPLSHVTIIRVDTTGVAKNYEFNKRNYGKTSCTNLVYDFLRLIR